MRTKLKEWKNGPGGKWSARIIWYEDDVSIRLKTETPDGVINGFYKYPDGKTRAQAAWDAFKLQWREPNGK